MSHQLNLEYLKNIVAQEVHLRGIQSFFDFTPDDQKKLINECKGLLSEMIKDEHLKQYGQYIGGQQ